MKNIPNKKVLLRIKQTEKSIKTSEQILRNINENPKNWQLHYDELLIRTSIRIKQKHISHLKTKLFVF